MMDRVSSSVPVELSSEERRLIAGLHDLPSEAMRLRLTEVMEEVLDFVREPACAERQADGVPCQGTELACEDCREVLALLRGIERRLGRS
jgi:hypothetical protein